MHSMLQAPKGQPLLDSCDLEGIAKRIKSGMQHTKPLANLFAAYAPATCLERLYPVLICQRQGLLMMLVLMSALAL